MSVSIPWYGISHLWVKIPLALDHRFWTMSRVHIEVGLFEVILSALLFATPYKMITPLSPEFMCSIAVKDSRKNSSNLHTNSLVWSIMRDPWFHNIFELVVGRVNSWCSLDEVAQLMTQPLRKKAIIHQVTPMLAASKNVLFPGRNHL